MAEKKFTTKSIIWSVRRSTKYGAIVEVSFDDNGINTWRSFDDEGYIDILGTKYFATEIFSEAAGSDVFTWLKKQVDETKSEELSALFNSWKLKKDSIDNTESGNVDSVKKEETDNIKSMFKGVTGSTIETEKQKVDENIKNTSNVLDSVKSKTKNFSLSDLGDVKLSTVASSLGIDSSKLDKIKEIKDSISLSGISLNNTDSIKKLLLDKLDKKNLVKDSLNKDLLESIGKDVGVNPNQLENMLKSQDSVKILGDIKSIDQYDKLDDLVKEKIIQNNHLPNVDLLNDIMSVSVDLNSNDKGVKEKAISSSKKLQPQFAKLFGMPPVIQTDELNDINITQTNSKNFIENFDKIDYRIQKVAAESMGFSDNVGGVGKLKETLNKIKEYKKLDELSKSLKDTLLGHVETLNKQQNINSGSLPDYKEQHGITDQQYDAAVETAYSVKSIEDDKERFEYEQEGKQSIDEILKELDSNADTNGTDKNGIPSYLGLDSNLFQKDSNGKIIEPFVYNGDVVLTDKKDENGNALNSIPIKFNRVIGNFICKNMGLTNLQNCPETVNGNFDCSNNNLKNLIGGPKNVYGTYYAMNNKLESLKGIFTVNNLNITNNMLKNLDSTPSSGEQSNLFITGNGDFSNNLINDLLSNIDIHGELNLSNNMLVDTSFNTVGNQLPRLYNNSSFIAVNQKNGSKLSESVVRLKLQLNENTKVIV